MRTHRITLTSDSPPFVDIEVRLPEGTVFGDLESYADQALREVSAEQNDRGALARFMLRSAFRLSGIEVKA